MEYDQQIARHYLAYRPPLHLEILQQTIGKDAPFSQGLDFGCGTGTSTVALSKLCHKVVGVDVSLDMIKLATASAPIQYVHLEGGDLPFPDQFFDVFTFAGSLYYAKSQQLLDEVIRTGKNGGTIVVYDFNILVDDLLQRLFKGSYVDEDPLYDHQVNFSGLSTKFIQELTQVRENSFVKIKPSDLGHLLLSAKSVYQIFVSTQNNFSHSTIWLHNLRTYLVERTIIWSRKFI